MKTIQGIPINPHLPDGFYDCPPEERPEDHLAWWGRVYIRETRTDSGSAYSVYRLDRSEAFGPTRHALFLELDPAVAYARKMGNAKSIMEFL